MVLMLLCVSPALANGMSCGREDGQAPVLLVVGDSLSAAYGIALADGWVALLQDRLSAPAYEFRVINASVSGDTTSGGLARLPLALRKHHPALVVIELGGNDGLRGLPVKVMKTNLERMIEVSREQGAEVVLLGIHIPSNYGPRYAQKFHDVYLELAQQHDLPLIDFFLDGVALDETLMQADGIHPNAIAQPRLLDNAWPAIAAALRRHCGLTGREAEAAAP